MKLVEFFSDVADDIAPLFQHESLDTSSELETYLASLWRPLVLLKDFLKTSIIPNLPESIETGVPVPRTMALLPDGSYTYKFEVINGDTTKGLMKILIDGKEVSGASLLYAGSIFMDRDVQIGKSVVVEPGALIKGPTIIKDNTEIRQGAYIRGWCLIGSRCVVGHTTEVKHSIFLDGAKAGHFAYIGDSILGADVNLGAGTKLANLPFASKTILVPIKESAVNSKKIKHLDTKLRKLGAILGDRVQTGCNSVTNPGVLLGPESLVTPTCSVYPGYYPRHSVIK